MSLLLLQQSPTGSMMGMVYLLVMFGILYFLLIMPMQRQKKQQQKMLQGLQNGNTVVTSGGLMGTIVAINPDETLVLRVRPDNVKLLIARSAVTGMISEESSTKK
jgi:preprotein translocase subunit YajC